MMERPTCGTCPYWETSSIGSSSACPDDANCCIRYPGVLPTPALFEVFREEFGDDEDQSPQDAVWPLTKRINSCGEHPDFPAYIASLKKPAVPPSGRHTEDPRPKYGPRQDRHDNYLD